MCSVPILCSVHLLHAISLELRPLQYINNKYIPDFLRVITIRKVKEGEGEDSGTSEFVVS